MKRPPSAGSGQAPRARIASGFTLLEVIVALAILGMSMMAIFNINSEAIYAHVYAKKLTVATLLARSKMTDIEQELFDKGFQVDDDDQGGDFSEEGWPSFKWRAKIIAPKTNGLSPDQLLGAIFGIPMGGGKGDASGIGALAGMFGAGQTPPGGSSTSAPIPGMGGSNPANSILSAMGPASGLIQTQFQGLVDQLTKAVREVHLTVTWKEGKLTESFDIVTHIVSLGPGSDRNGGLQQEQAAKSGQNAQNGATGDQWVRMDNGQPVPNPMPAPNGSGMVDPASGQPLITAAQWAQQHGGAMGGMPGGIPGMPGGIPGMPGGLPGATSPLLNNNLKTLNPGLFNRPGRLQ
jgi:general secretion pathway protein I